MLQEEFRNTAVDERLGWYNEPTNWLLQNDTLILHSDEKTDFWQKTHYDMHRDNGHFLYSSFETDFTLETRVESEYQNQYDQAGLMVRISPECWIKTSCEMETGRTNRLGAVVTNHGYSDWSTQEVPKSLTDIRYRIKRNGEDYIVEYYDGEWVQLRMTHLHEPGPVSCGIYACSPKSGGFIARFHYLNIVTSS
jgi:regulation of enolase protein 1 (concanavalin A-like superfamily)